MNGTPTFLKLVALCGLSSMFASHAMARAIIRAGIWPARMTMSDVPAVLTEVERAIQPFLDGPASEDVMAQIRSWWWAHGAEAPRRAVG